MTKTVVFDLRPPTFSEPTLSPARPVPENEVEVTVNVSDPGRNATGIPGLINSIPPVHLHFSKDGTNYTTVNMFPVEGHNGTYMGTIPGQPVNSVIRYYISANDNSNNTGKSAIYTFNTFTSPTPPGGGPNGGFDPIALAIQYWYLVVLLALAVLGGAIYYVKKSYF